MIDSSEIDAIMESTAIVVREYVSIEMQKLGTQMEARILDDMRQRLKDIPTIQGEKGDKGDTVIGPQGAPGKDADLEFLSQLLKSEVTSAVAALPVPTNGKDADPDLMRQQVLAEVRKAVFEIPKPKDGTPGQNGKDADPELIRSLTENAFSAVADEFIRGLP